MTRVLRREVDPAVSAGTTATYAAFIFTGFAFASWASRIPQVRDGLQLGSADLGLVLLSIAAGSVIALPLAGLLVAHLGSRRTVAAMAVVNGTALAFVGLGYQFGVVPVLVGLFGFGFAQGAWDVAMNVQGAVVERRLGRAIMSRFHAGFSVGTVAGALVGAAMVALGVPVTAHLVTVGVLVAAVVPFAVRRFLPDTAADEPQTGSTSGSTTDSTSESTTRSAGGRAFAAWREPRTLMVGVFVLAFAFAEGTGNDWTSLAFIDGYATSPAVGTLGFAGFLAAMTVGRWFGPALLDRFGRARTVRVLAVVGVVGVVLFVFGGSTPVGFVGVLLWGGGVSLGFPVGMSAGADEPEMAAPRVSVIASIGYCAFLAGPPLVGFLGDEIGVLRAITAVAVLLGLAILIAGSVRAPAGAAELR